MTKSKKNRLSQETSPYLLQHAHNPVDWYPWGKEALDRAVKEDKPIFLSIGYSACHWCHVMEKESFENTEIAALLNESFINIKVDREERQDLDHIYMSAVQAMTQHGGWPMSVFLTPERKPFYGGTYFPPEDKMGMPGFKKIIAGVAGAWRNRREEVEKSADQLVSAISQMNNSIFELKPSEQGINAKALTDSNAAALKNHFDFDWGGFGRAPKFFHTMDIRLCLRAWKNSKNPDYLRMVETTLEAWSRGGIYDHLGGGFHRYSTDAHWLVPHFEKMLYDNALVAQTYLEAYQATKKEDFARVARETLDYVLKEMTSPEGGFFSTQDADSEGIEGKFYAWSMDEIKSILDSDSSSTFCKVFQVSPHGNWEETNILHRRKSWEALAEELGQDPQWLQDSLEASKRKLLLARSTRVPPFKDEKIVLSWNGLMIDTLAFAHQVLDDSRYLEAARKAAHFVWDKMRQAKSNHLFHSFHEGQSQLHAYLDDYGCFINGLVTLFESDFDSHWVSWADNLMKNVLEHFWDEETHSFYFTASDHEQLVFRPKEFQDGALPSATAMALTSLVRLGKLKGDSNYLETAEKVLKSHQALLNSPMAAGQMCIAAENLLNHPKEIVIIPGDDGEATGLHPVLRVIRDEFLPNKVVLWKTEENKDLALFSKRNTDKNRTTIYVCENSTCLAPITEIGELVSTLRN